MRKIELEALDYLREAIDDYIEKQGVAPTVDDIELGVIADDAVPVDNWSLLHLVIDDLGLGYADVAYNNIYSLIEKNISDRILGFLYDNFEEVLNEKND